MIRTAYAIAERMWYRGRRPEVDLKYRAFIRQWPCIGCGSRRWVEFAHTGLRGLGQKADDKDGLPVCAACHRTGPKALHKIGPVAFQRVHGFTFSDLRRFFRGMYEAGCKS